MNFIVGENIIGAPKYEIIMLLLVLSIASCKVVAFNLLCFLFGIISLLLFLIYPYNVIALPTIAITIVVGLKGDSKKKRKTLLRSL